MQKIRWRVFLIRCETHKVRRKLGEGLSFPEKHFLLSPFCRESGLKIRAQKTVCETGKPLLLSHKPLPNLSLFPCSLVFLPPPPLGLFHLAAPLYLGWTFANGEKMSRKSLPSSSFFVAKRRKDEEDDSHFPFSQMLTRFCPSSTFQESISLRAKKEQQNISPLRCNVL